MNFPNINPTAFNLFGFEIKWYGISYAASLILALIYCKTLSKKYNIVKEKIFDDILIWVALGIILGGRLGYVVFYNIHYYIIILNIYYLELEMVVCLFMAVL